MRPEGAFARATHSPPRPPALRIEAGWPKRREAVRGSPPRRATPANFCTSTAPKRSKRGKQILVLALSSLRTASMKHWRPHLEAALAYYCIDAAHDETAIECAVASVQKDFGDELTASDDGEERSATRREWWADAGGRLSEAGELPRGFSCKASQPERNSGGAFRRPGRSDIRPGFRRRDRALRGQGTVPPSPPRRCPCRACRGRRVSRCTG